jgi:hypothetical protein
VKTWELYPTRYLQEIQVYNNLILFSTMELHFFLIIFTWNVQQFFCQIYCFNVERMQSRHDGYFYIGLES